MREVNQGRDRGASPGHSRLQVSRADHHHDAHVKSAFPASGVDSDSECRDGGTVAIISRNSDSVLGAIGS